ncbi:MAG: FAD-binding oxidoreductase, partial [Patescibacteria group bacterium]
MPYSVKILMTEFVTRDVKRFITEKPAGFVYTPGQATDVAVNLPELKDKTRPFTFTSLNSDLVLEFTIKSYPDHDGVTKKLHELKPGDELLISDPWGTIHYKDRGVFIAGGAGITPFIAIFRDLYQKGKLAGN